MNFSRKMKFLISENQKTSISQREERLYKILTAHVEETELQGTLIYMLLFLFFGLLVLVFCTLEARASTLPASLLNSSCFSRVHNRGKPPQEAVQEIIDFVRSAPNEVFEVNSSYDIYSSTVGNLGPWKSLKHRRAAMANVLIVLGGFESSWRWNAGIDTTNASSAKNKCNEEAGMFQASGNSMNFSHTLKDLFRKHCRGEPECARFIPCSKTDRRYVIEHTARLLRFTTRHHGPILRREIHAWLRRDCVEAIERLL